MENSPLELVGIVTLLALGMGAFVALFWFVGDYQYVRKKAVDAWESLRFGDLRSDITEAKMRAAAAAQRANTQADELQQLRTELSAVQEHVKRLEDGSARSAVTDPAMNHSITVAKAVLSLRERVERLESFIEAPINNHLKEPEIA